MQFPGTVSDLLHYNLSRDELADVLLRFLVETRSPKPAQNGKGEPDEQMQEGGRELSEEDRYLAARFIQSLTEDQPELIDPLAQIASIGLLAEVVDDFSHPISVPKNVDLSIYLDAPVALDYLGLSGVAIKEDVARVLDSLAEIGCRLFVFPITCVEMAHNLNSMLALQPPRRHGYTHEAMLKREVLPDFVRAVANSPDSALKARGVEVRQIDLKSFPSLHRYFTDEQYHDFFSSVYWVKEVMPREHDATSLTLLMRLREGRQSADIFNTKSVFVTRNGAFSRFSRKYCLESHLLSDYQEGPIIHQRELATTAWLRTGLGAAEAIPRGHLVASCERVLRVRPEVIDAIRKKVADTTDKSEQLELLLQDYRSVRKLADETLNDENVVTAENAEQLLDLMRKATAAEVKKDYDQRLRTEREKHRTAVSESKEKFEGELRARSDEVQQLAAQVDRLGEQNELVTAQHVKVEGAIVASVNQTLGTVRWALTILLLLVGVIAALNVATEWWGWPLVLVGFSGVYQLLAQLLHWPQVGIEDILNRLAKWLVAREIRRRGTDWLSEEQFSIEKGRVIGIRDHSPV